MQTKREGIARQDCYDVIRGKKHTRRAETYIYKRINQTKKKIPIYLYTHTSIKEKQKKRKKSKKKYTQNISIYILHMQYKYAKRCVCVYDACVGKGREKKSSRTVV